MVLFVAPLRIRSPCKAPKLRASSTSSRTLITASNAAPNKRVIRAIASVATIATTVGAVLTLCSTSVQALSPPPSPSVAAVQHTNATYAHQTASLLTVSAADDISTSTQTHVSTGQKAANFLRARGFSNEVAVLAISALPVVELRGGIPVGFLLGLPPLHTFLLSVIGNMLPVIPLMSLLRLSFVQRIASRVLDRARRKAESVSNSSSQARALALFVGVPLPGTGAWTGCVIAFVLGMSSRTTFVSLLVGVISAAVIVTCLCLLGKTGGAIAASVLLGTGLISLLNSFRGASVPSEDTPRENGVASQRCE